MLRAGFVLLTAMLAMVWVTPVRSQASGPRVYALADAPAELRPAIDRAVALLAPLEREFLTDVTSALRTDGPSGAMKSCHLQPTVHELQIAREQGIAVGRTSDRLRNPINTPRAWAAPVVNKYAGRPAAGVAGFVVDNGTTIGVMRPLTEQPMCGGCHGRSDKLEPKVVEALRDRYPADHAVGFQEGEIRGWFWAEVPKNGR
jgi:Protein of unknown function (DUF3365)